MTGGQAIVMRNVDLFAGEAEAVQILQAAFTTMVEDLPAAAASAAPTPAEPVASAAMPPAFVPATALAALRQLYQLCLALADRSMPEDQVRAVCAALLPPGATPGDILSADLSLRHLPALHRMARAVSDTDPLVAGLEAAAVSFPLSSVGIPLAAEASLAPLQRSGVLWRLYLDRILEQQDDSRLHSPAVRAGIRDALGLHPQLAPRLAAKLALLDA